MVKKNACVCLCAENGEVGNDDKENINERQIDIGGTLMSYRLVGRLVGRINDEVKKAQEWEEICTA